jgi:hypothetical protein
MSFLQDKFAQTGYQVTGLLRQMVLSDAFYRVAPPQEQPTIAGAGQAGSASVQEASL